MADEQTLDPDIAEWLIKVTAADEPVSVAEARERARTTNAAALDTLDPELVPAHEVDDEIPATDDAPALPIRVLRPKTESGETTPTVLYFHGGGWILGDLQTHLVHARRICTQVHATVVSVDYRLAPEYRFPTAFDDALRAARWVSERLGDFGGEDTLVLAGDSAGGQLASSVALACRDAGIAIAAQLLLYPVTDVAGRYEDAEVNERYMSRRSPYQRFGLTLETMATFARAYVDEADAADWRVSPKRSSDLAGVAPAVIHTSTLDVLRTEGNFYGDDLRAAGVDVISREFPSLNHSYFGLGGVSAVADAAAGQAADDLREILRRRAR